RGLDLAGRSRRPADVAGLSVQPLPQRPGDDLAARGRRAHRAGEGPGPRRVHLALAYAGDGVYVGSKQVGPRPVRSAEAIVRESGGLSRTTGTPGWEPRCSGPQSVGPPCGRARPPPLRRPSRPPARRSASASTTATCAARTTAPSRRPSITSPGWA